MRESQHEQSPVAKPVMAEDAFLAFHEVTPDGFMMLRPIRSDAGEIIDFEFTFVNRAAGKIVGLEPKELTGKRLLVEMPGNKDEGLFDAYVSVIETGQTWQNEFHYNHGGINAWFRTTATKSGEDLALSFADISEIRAGHERLRNLIDSVIAFIGVLSLDGVLLEINEPALAAAGLPRDELIGKPFWECYWWDVGEDTKNRLKEAILEAAKGNRVRYDVEIRVVDDQRIWIDFQLVPVMDASGTVTEIIPSGVDITERKRADAHRELLIKELSHRVKNTLATIQSIAGQTVRSTEKMEDFRASFGARLRAIAASHDLLVEYSHQDVPLEALVRGQVLPFTATDDRLETAGDDVLVPGDVAHLLGLILHELATNASKYGALSVDEGALAVNWHIDTKPDTQTLVLTWNETNGPKVNEPTRTGFGTRLIERTLSPYGQAVLNYEPDGFSCRLEVVLE